MTIIKKTLLIAFFLSLIFGATSLKDGSSPRAHATFNATNYTNYLIDDVIFTNNSSMTAAQIQIFLQNIGSGLASYKDYADCSSNPSFMASYYPCGQNVTAANIIYDAAQAYGLNPQSIIATLQKEQGVITAPNPTSSQLNFAMSYGCPDSTGCTSNSHPGFFQQVDWGTWQLRLNIELMSGRSYFGIPPSSYACNGPTRYYSQALKPGNDIHFYDDNGTDFNHFVIATASTASLYCYTPHPYNNPTGKYGLPVYGSTGLYYTGSYNFVYYFTTWFGSTFAEPYNYSYVTSSNPNITLQPGQLAQNNSITIKNTGFSTWYADGSVPAGEHPVRLALRGYGGTPFADPGDPNWLGTDNQIKMTPGSVAPGQNATFTFNLVGPMRTYPFHYMFFVPVVDGVRFMRDLNMGFGLANQTPPYAFVSQQSLPNPLLPNQSATGSVTIQNTGSASWYADGAVPAGQHPIRLAVRGYENVNFADTADPNWLGTKNQIKMTPGSVAPGQNATFTFKVVGPLAATSRSLFFVPVLDGVTFLADNSIGMGVNTPAPSASYQYLSATNPPSQMSAGSTASVSLTVKNTGNVVWQPESFSGTGKSRLRLNMRRPSYHNSVFYDLIGGWLNQSQVSYNGPAVMPGETATFTFNWKAPSQTGSYVDYFAPVLDGFYEMQDIGMGFAVQVTP